MTEQLITFETAKSAKEKGWHVSKYGTVYWDKAYYLCEEDNYFFSDKEIGDLILENSGSISNGALIADAPTQSLLQRWLREVYYIDVNVICLKHKTYFYKIFNHYSECDNSELVECKLRQVNVVKDTFVKYENALEAGLHEALKLI